MKLIRNILLWLQAIDIAIKAILHNQVYVLRKAALGDVLWVEPVLRKLAENGRTVFLITEFCSLFDNFPYSNFHCINNSDKRYKRAAKLLHALRLKKHVVYLNNSYEKRPNQHFLHAYQEIAHLPKEEEYPKLYLNEEEKRGYHNLKPYAVIHLETTSPLNHRQIYGIQWQSVAQYLQEKELTPYFIAKYPEDYQLPYHRKLSSTRDLISFIYNAELFIGVDSGPSHIAASLGVPSLLFFGSINPWFRHFKALFSGLIIQQSCEFAGCYHRILKRKEERSCLLVGNEGTPKCCVFSNELVENNIDRLLSRSFASL